MAVIKMMDGFGGAFLKKIKGKAMIRHDFPQGYLRRMRSLASPTCQVLSLLSLPPAHFRLFGFVVFKNVRKYQCL